MENSKNIDQMCDIQTLSYSLIDLNTKFCYGKQKKTVILVIYLMSLLFFQAFKVKLNEIDSLDIIALCIM